MRLIRIAALPMLGLAAVGFAACAGGGSSNTGRAEGVPGVPDGAAFVDQDGLKFGPASLTVAATEDVYFKNSETTVHTVTINGDNASGTMQRDDVFTWTPPGSGEYKISCDFHPQMKATIKVE